VSDDRISRPESCDPTGGGLGLAIANSVVLRHGATIALEPDEHERGLLVLVRFPAQLALRLCMQELQAG
jgi:signal transduction histidine kinase